jgi:putative membrane protein insertion efficiency factor
MKKIAFLGLTIYKKFISDLLVINFGKGCRFLPTCSDYAKQAIQKYGFYKGTRLAVKRVLRCHPLAKTSFDPVP